MQKVRYRPSKRAFVPFSGYDLQVHLFQLSCARAAAVVFGVHHACLPESAWHARPFLYAVAGRSTRFELALVQKFDITQGRWLSGMEGSACARSHR